MRSVLTSFLSSCLLVSLELERVPNKQCDQQQIGDAPLTAPSVPPVRRSRKECNRNNIQRSAAFRTVLHTTNNTQTI
jgi:hypothetical protein